MILEPETGRLRYANAGHNAAMILRESGQVEWLGSTGMPLGLMPEGDCKGCDARLEPGDILVLYSDGITEATNEEGDEYCRERLFRICHRNRKGDFQAMVEALAKDLESFVGDVPYGDDRTLLAVRRKIERDGN